MWTALIIAGAGIAVVLLGLYIEWRSGQLW